MRAIDGARRQVAAGRVTQIGLEIGAHRCICVLLALLEGPLLLGSVDAAEIADAGVHLRYFPRMNEVRNGNRRQHSDDGHDDHDFHKREPDSKDEFTFHNDFWKRGVNKAKGGLI